VTAGSQAAAGRGQGFAPRLIAAGVAAIIVAAFVMVAALAALGGASPGVGASSPEAESEGISALAEREIPPLYLRLYEQAAARYGLDWAILAGIGKVECDHGRAPSPSCTEEGEVNSAGAGGPMQFLASTWAEYGVDSDGAGPPDRWDPADAIYGAANYLRASGAPSDYGRAIFAYNHASWYVADVEAWAARYGGAQATAFASVGRSPLTGQATEEGDSVAGADLRLASETSTPVRFISGELAELDPEDGHVALIPVGVPASVQAMLVAGNELQDLPYGPDGHPDPLGASEEDCSSTVNYVLYRSGIRPLSEILHDNPLAQDYVGWGAPGPGRWVTIYASASPEPHVFMTIAGLRLDTSHNGTDVGPNRFENGPRWRILDHIPTWAHWSVRHPPGL
jgi:transglycosylase-like protein with SLT domain